MSDIYPPVKRTEIYMRSAFTDKTGKIAKYALKFISSKTSKNKNIRKKYFLMKDHKFYHGFAYVNGLTLTLSGGIRESFLI